MGVIISSASSGLKVFSGSGSGSSGSLAANASESYKLTFSETPPFRAKSMRLSIEGVDSSAVIYFYQDVTIDLTTQGCAGLQSTVYPNSSASNSVVNINSMSSIRMGANGVYLSGAYLTGNDIYLYYHNPASTSEGYYFDNIGFQLLG